MTYEVYNKSNYQKYKPILDQFLDEFSNSNDKLAKNYQINYTDLDEITLIISNNEVVAFSSILSRDIWPSNSRRILNRLVRNKKLPWSDQTFGTISKIMHDEQIEFCKKQGIDFVFISMEGKKKNWMKRWVNQANAYSPGWVQVPGMCRVCNGPPKSCMQNIAYKNISESLDKFLMLNNTISYEKYAELILQLEE